MFTEMKERLGLNEEEEDSEEDSSDELEEEKEESRQEEEDKQEKEKGKTGQRRKHKKHEFKKTYNCPKCERQFKQKCAYDRHVNQNHDILDKCDFCTWKFD